MGVEQEDAGKVTEGAANAKGGSDEATEGRMPQMAHGWTQMIAHCPLEETAWVLRLYGLRIHRQLATKNARMLPSGRLLPKQL